ncbi:DUF3035 domain-containing protein [Pelagibacterales bacterium SAG-MED11]|nr:DUF3035 domain-containing protein [Pelagibacterales bacterium SAG-MED11]
MEKISKLLILTIFIITLNSCGSVKDGFTNSKKKSTDEFLVKKKSPLVMPPEYGELPIPGNENQEQKNDENSQIKSLITGSENQTSKSQNSSNQDTYFESSILEKIKNN